MKDKRVISKYKTIDPNIETELVNIESRMNSAVSRIQKFRAIHDNENFDIKEFECPQTYP